MNVKKLIDCLTKEVDSKDRKKAQIQIFCGKQEYEIKDMIGFSLSPDIMIHLKKTKSPMLTPMVFKSKHSKMLKKKMKEIKQKLNETCFSNCVSQHSGKCTDKICSQRRI